MAVEVDPFKHPLLAVWGSGSAAGVGYQNVIGEVYTASVSSDGKSSSWPDKGTEPPRDTYWCEKGSSYIASAGNPFHGSNTYPNGALDIGFAQKIGNHYYMTTLIGVPAYGPTNGWGSHEYCPIFEEYVRGISFQWQKVCNGSGGKHRFRLIKVGGVFRTGNNKADVKLLDFSKVGTPELFKFSAGTFSGKINLSIRNSIRASQLVGLYFQVETEGQSTGTVSGSHIRIWDMDIDTGAFPTILPKKAVYADMKPNPGNYFIQTFI